MRNVATRVLDVGHNRRRGHPEPLGHRRLLASLCGAGHRHLCVLGAGAPRRTPATFQADRRAALAMRLLSFALECAEGARLCSVVRRGGKRLPEPRQRVFASDKPRDPLRDCRARLCLRLRPRVPGDKVPAQSREGATSALRAAEAEAHCRIPRLLLWRPGTECGGELDGARPGTSCLEVSIKYAGLPNRGNPGPLL